ncbi:glycosyltransferase [Mucilaginibacter terrae]|uniref:glycosyltransferase n=1 Tax=Mucilaginibacter terrae TaxID=1955052 RepID=UPI00362B4CC8
MTYSIDIVIPSFRLDEQCLLPLLNLPRPDGFDISYYLVADNPAVQVPISIQKLNGQNNIHLLINNQNLGYSCTRNRGIDTGKGDWILLLDDDVNPEPDLLYVYAQHILNQPNAIGFIGVTNFPEPIDAETKSLEILGVSTHCQRAKQESEMFWSGGANVMLNRKKLGSRRFLPELMKSTEDMELLFRNAFENKLQPYLAAPKAVVHHPWWKKGLSTIRLFLYGEGAGEAARLYPISLYTHYDFTNTLETLLLLVISILPALIFGWPLKFILWLAIAEIVSEFLTNYYRTIKEGHSYNINVACQVVWYKNAQEAGRLWSWLRLGRFQEIAQRTDGSFRKPHPQNFRFNRWKIIKLVIYILIIALLYIVIEF